MTNRLHQIISGIKYYVFSKHNKGYGIHSPFVYRFIRNVLMVASSNKCASKVKEEFEDFAKSYEFSVKMDEVGAGSQIKKKQFDLVKLAKTSGLATKYLQLFCEMVAYFEAERCLELGTCCGVTSAAMALKMENGRVATIEGNNDRADVAKAFFKQLKMYNIDLYDGEFSNVLAELSEGQAKFDLAFIDGDHTYEATIKNYNSVVSLMSENGIIILDDIYWTKEMTRAWEEIKLTETATVTIDLFRFGIVFLNRPQAKEHFVIRY